MKTVVTSRELRALEGPERSSRIASLSSALRAAPNGELKDLDFEITALGRELGVNPTEVRGQVTRGELHETARVCELLMLLKLRDRLTASR